MVPSYQTSRRYGLGVPSLLQRCGLLFSKVKIPNSWLISKLSKTCIFFRKKNANNNKNLNQFLLHLFGVAGYFFVSGITASIDTAEFHPTFLDCSFVNWSLQILILLFKVLSAPSIPLFPSSKSYKLTICSIPCVFHYDLFHYILLSKTKTRNWKGISTNTSFVLTINYYLMTILWLPKKLFVFQCKFH